ncbi:STAS domain-containing protein [Aureimonas populi]|uniref:STAS domain-containing protein n=1 Tax=Aureimonas populi TaxID=1701758 RepID=A0ABW5CMZ5_9HYPH|nr:STAS domain-containing protein [Aureimonas populi]
METGDMMEMGQDMQGERPVTVELPAILDLRAAAPLAGKLLALRGQPLALDASKVERIGGQCLAVLISAARTWKADEETLTLEAPSDEFVAGLSLLGLTVPALVEGAEEPADEDLAA